MKAHVKSAAHAARRPDTPAPVPKRESKENPLWVINIAMAAFFVVVALVMMTS